MAAFALLWSTGCALDATPPDLLSAAGDGAPDDAVAAFLDDLPRLPDPPPDDLAWRACPLPVDGGTHACRGDGGDREADYLVDWLRRDSITVNGDWAILLSACVVNRGEQWLTGPIPVTFRTDQSWPDYQVFGTVWLDPLPPGDGSTVSFIVVHPRTTEGGCGVWATVNDVGTSSNSPTRTIIECRHDNDESEHQPWLCGPG